MYFSAGGTVSPVQSKLGITHKAVIKAKDLQMIFQMTYETDEAVELTHGIIKNNLKA